MADTFTFTLDDETEKRLFDLLTEVDVSKTPSFSIKDKYGGEAEYVKVVRCKDCKYRKPKKTTNLNSHCVRHNRAVMADDYCSKAERKEE